MKRLDLSGQLFGELLVLAYSHSHRQPCGQKRAMWHVKCSCGTEKIMSTATLTGGGTVSCGHIGKLHREAARRAGATQTGQGHKYTQYKASARHRGLSFDLSLDEFSNLLSQDCTYCGLPPQKEVITRSKKYSILYNGIDRENNTLGYTIKNCVPCCHICNRMKGTLSKEEFLFHIERIVKCH